jgi:hypothetical protein
MSDNNALPEVVGRYQDAHDGRDTEVALTAFAPNASVVDDGRKFNGADDLRYQFVVTRGLISELVIAP